MVPILLLWTVGCNTTPAHLYVKKGASTGETITGVAGNRLSDVKNFEGWQAAVYLSPQRILTKYGTERFQIVIQLTRGGGEYILVKPGRSMAIEVDGKRIIYATKQGSGPRRSIVRGSLGETTLSESAVYENVPKRDIELIANAKTAKVKIVGQKGPIYAEFSEKNFSAFQTLLENNDVSAP
jgi:hypothetical protein